MSLDAFLHAERSWSKVKAFQAFETDQHTSPPKQFVTNDGAAILTAGKSYVTYQYQYAKANLTMI